jgi:nicotinamide riboside kinase
MLEQQGAEDDVAAACASGLVIGDSAALMIAVYSIAYFDDLTLLEPAVDLARGYDLVVWCDIDLPWEADGIQRDGPEVRAREHQIIGEVVRERLLPAGIHVELVSGTRALRAEAARRAWQLLPLEEPT